MLGQKLITGEHEPGLQPLSQSERTAIQEWTADIVADEARLSAMSNQIAGAVGRAVVKGCYILRRDPEIIAEQLRHNMSVVIPGRDAEGNETFHYYWGLIQLVVPEHFADFPVLEGGTLISNPQRRELPGAEKYRSSHAIQLTDQLPIYSDDALVISTVRSKVSRRALSRAGAEELSREDYPMLDALTCDPGCAPGSDGRLAGVYNIARTACGDCIACPVNTAYGGNALSDGCRLMTLSTERAQIIEQAISERFSNQASLARAVLIEGASYENYS
jgi:hypothetical protein